MVHALLSNRILPAAVFASEELTGIHSTISLDWIPLSTKLGRYTCMNALATTLSDHRSLTKETAPNFDGSVLILKAL